MHVIAEITDEMFGLEKLPFCTPKVRFGARGIVKREDGKIAIFFKKKKNEYKLPGGGIEKEETATQAFEREVLEEVGCEVKDVMLMGMIKELKSKENFQQISYVFSGVVSRDMGSVNMTQKEIDEGAIFVWFSPKEALDKITKCENELKASDYDDVYRTKFMNYRDREILKYYMEKFKKQI